MKCSLLVVKNKAVEKKPKIESLVLVNRGNVHTMLLTCTSSRLGLLA